MRARVELRADRAARATGPAAAPRAGPARWRPGSSPARGAQRRGRGAQRLILGRSGAWPARSDARGAGRAADAPHDLGHVGPLPVRSCRFGRSAGHGRSQQDQVVTMNDFIAAAKAQQLLDLADFAADDARRIAVRVGADAARDLERRPAPRMLTVSPRSKRPTRPRHARRQQALAPAAARAPRPRRHAIAPAGFKVPAIHCLRVAERRRGSARTRCSARRPRCASADAGCAPLAMHRWQPAADRDLGGGDLGLHAARTDGAARAARHGLDLPG